MPIILPKKCLRGRKDCYPISQHVADGPKSRTGNPTDFICCGIHNGRELKRKHPPKHHGDKFRVCWKTESGVNEKGEWDKRDILTHVAVLNRALMVEENMTVNAAKKKK